MDQEEFSRYESPELQLWKKKDTEEQFKIVEKISKKYEDRLTLVSVRHQAIKVELEIPKEERYNLLVDYETYVRKELNNIPIIVLLEGKKDANKRRR